MTLRFHLRKCLLAVCLCALSLSLPAASARIFYCDPVRGNLQDDGSAERPWPRIEDVLKAKLVQLVALDGKLANPNAPVKPGDTILLGSGYHGEIRIRGGFNDQFITIAAENGHTPQVSHVEIGPGRKWRVRGLTISPSFAPATPGRRPDSMVKLGENGGDENGDMVIEDCFLYTARDASAWTAQDWMNASSGIWLGRHGKGYVARNNYVLNTRFGINLCAPDSLCEGNIVANFSGDGIRVTRDGLVVQYNLVKNIYVSAKDGDNNHDDGMQAFLFNKGRGTVRNVTVRGNLILDREDPNQPFKSDMQGIGFFDGPLVEFLVENNVVQTDHYHGISLYDAQNCQIRSNACFCLSLQSRAKPWIMLGQKRNDAHSNIVSGNIAHSFSLKADQQVQQTNNVVVTEEAFQRKRADVLALIREKFGAVHPVAKLPR